MRATSQTYAPPSLPASLPIRAPREPRPEAAEAAFQELSRNPPPRDRGPRYCFKETPALLLRLLGETGSERSGSDPVGVDAWEFALL